MVDLVGLLKEEETALEKRLYALQSAIEALEGGVAKTVKRAVKRAMSAATKRKLSIVAKARWAKIKKG